MDMPSTRKKERHMGSLSHRRKASGAEAKHEAGKAFGADQLGTGEESYFTREQ